jgi:hypothetical protein
MSFKFGSSEEDSPEVDSDVLNTEVPDLDNKESFIKITEEALAAYRQALAFDPYKGGVVLSTSDFEDILEKLLISVRVDERKRADRDHEIGKLNELILTEEEIVTATMTLEEIDAWKKENNV